MKIAALHNIQGRFLRSIQLERDFADPAAMDGYVVSPRVRETFDRLAQGLADGSSQRAWRITGDYGSGKSSFALLIAQVFADRNSRLPKSIKKAIDLGRFKPHERGYVPVLITGAREPLSRAVLRRVSEAVRQTGDGRNRFKVADHIAAALAFGENGLLDDSAAVRLIVEANHELIAKSKGGGLLIILDELGKFLEFAALHPEQQDVFFLQQLAEAAVRSGNEPLFVVGLLHQGIGAYSDRLSQASQKEWEKIAGRYEEIIFEQPLEQVVHLISASLSIRPSLPRGTKSVALEAMNDAIELGWYGPAPGVTNLKLAAPSLYPLHATVIPALVRLFSRFGQNERSLFSFLLSNEPFALQSFGARDAGSNVFFRLHDLYDYAGSSFGNRLSLQSYRNHWNHIDSLIRSFPAKNDTDRAVLKTVGLLNLLNAPELVATEDAIRLAVGDLDPSARCRDVISRLHKQSGVLYLRGRIGGYSLWSNTSVNLESAYEEAGKAITANRAVTSRLTSKLSTRPIVARRHYIQKGNLRHFEIVYCPVTELQQRATEELLEADGRILIPLCETPSDVTVARDFASAYRGRREVLIGITEPLNHLEPLMQEVERWEWVQTNTPELKDDRYAAEEVSRQLRSSLHTLDKRVQHYVGLAYTAGATSSGLRWFSDGAHVATGTGKPFLALISNLCDELYGAAPEIHNELVNRRSLSSAAASARMRLMELMVSSENQPYFGMDPVKKPPEMSIYLSLVRGGGLHQEGDGRWHLSTPSADNDPCRLRPALDRTLSILRENVDGRVNVAAIFRQLRVKPFGVRDGVLPILLVALVLIRKREIAVYENGTFLTGFTNEALRRLARSPQSFELQYCKIAGVRSAVFEKLVELLGVQSANGSAEILEVVRPLCTFVASLPPYTQRSRRLSNGALAVRDCILNAQDPAPLVFTQLPAALGIPPFSEQDTGEEPKAVQSFVEKLKVALDELRLALPMLRDRIRTALLSRFEAQHPPSQFDLFRGNIASRAESLLVSVREADLKAFCFRLSDQHMSEAEWVDSIASFVANSPPARWRDEDEFVFNERLEVRVEHFLRVETLNFSSRPDLAGDSVRLALTRRDGDERDQVIHLSKKEGDHSRKIASAVMSVLPKNRKVSLGALSGILWTLLDAEKQNL